MKLLVVLLSFLLSSVSSHSHENPFNSIAKEISGSNSTTTFNVWHVNSLLEKIGFKNCSNTAQRESCQLCLDSSELLNWYGYQSLSSFNKTQFESLFSGIVYMITPIIQGSVGAVCNKSFAAQKKNLTQTPFNSLLRQYGDGHGSLEEKHIDKLLEDVNTTLKFRLTKKPCFDVHDALKGAELSETVKNAKELDKLSSYLVLQLLEGHCIAEHANVHKSTLPQPEEFIDLLFTEYAKNGIISLAKFESLTKKLGIGNEPKTVATQDDHQGHDHRKRRSVGTELEWVVSDQSHLRKRRAAATGNATGKVTGKCFTPENLLSIHSVKASTGINKAQFKTMCPSLVQQVESGACKTSTTKTSSKEEGWKPWISAITAVFILSLGSLTGIFFAPFSDKKSFTIILTFLIAVAVSTLLGDAILHLVPHSMGLHKHESGSTNSHSHSSLTAKDSYIWKSCIFIVGVYIFYLFELYLHTIPKRRHVHGLEETHQHVGKGRTHSITAGTVEIINERNGRGAAQKKDSGYIGAVCGLHKCEEEVFIDLKRVEENTLDTVCSWTRHNYVWF